jgi:TonB-dependent receptor
MKNRTALTFMVGWLFASVAAEAQTSGTIEGRVYNQATGVNLERARLTVEGTLLESFTDAEGRYRLSNVSPGQVQVKVFYTGLGLATGSINVIPGGTIQQDFPLSAAERKPEVDTSGAPILLDKFIVGDSREMTGTAIAINEQRFAPNMKNVVSTDEFGDVPDGNVTEFLKFVPGVSFNSGREISINGVPTAYVPVTIGGFSTASLIGGGGEGGAGRGTAMDVFTTSNLSRIEVSFSPTPESDGSALAGSVNMVPRSSFERSRPAFKASAYYSILNNGRDIEHSSPFKKFHPGFDFSWIAPVNKNFGYTISGGLSTRMTDMEQISNVWRGGGTATNGVQFPNTPFGQPYLSSIGVAAHGRKASRSSLAATFDYKFSSRDRLSLSLQSSDFYANQDNQTLTFDVGRVLPGQFSLSATRGAVGQGTLGITNARFLRRTWLYMPSLVWRHDGPSWKTDAGVALSRSRNRARSIEEGVFNQTTIRRTGVTVSFEDVGFWRPRTVTVTDGVTGAPVDPFALANYVVTGATGHMRSTDDTRRSAYANARRDFAGSLPLTLKAGVDLREATREGRGFSTSYTYLGPDGRASTTPAGSDDLATPFLNPTFGQRIHVNNFPRLTGISNGLLLDHYRANPTYFGSPNANTIYRSEVGFSYIATETVSSAYVRGDLALFQNRLKLAGGVRAEQTNIDARGPLSDPTRNYQRDAQGRPILGANGRPLPITTDPLEMSKLTYLDRRTHVEKEYLRLFPNLNASFNLRENLIARVAVYTSVGRPAFSQYAGALSLPETDQLPSPSNLISVPNVGIKAWSSQTVNVRLEYYFAGLGQFSVGAFRRDFKNFFGNTVFRATPEFLAPYGLDPNLYGAYDVSTQYNLTSRVRMEGTNVNYKQALTFLPAWARGVQVFGNLSVQRALGDAASDFSGYTPKTINWGASLTRERLVVNLNWHYRGRARRDLVAAGPSIEPGTYNWLAPRLVTDVVAEYRLTRKFWVFANLRNLYHVQEVQEIYGPSTPAIARGRISNADYGSLWTFGVKGSF